MIPARRYPRIRAGGFTLIEVLVALAVFMLIATLLVQMSDSTMRVTNHSQRRIEVDSDARQALSQISADVSRAIVRSDLPWRIEKSSGNDSIAFFAHADAYTPGRGISKVGFRVDDHVLQRGAEATSWDSNDATALPFTASDLSAVPGEYLEIDDSNFESLNQNVFRLEIAFLTADGRIVRDTSGNGSKSLGNVINFAFSPRAEPKDVYTAIIVAVAAIDNRARERMSDAEFANLTTKLPDAADGEDLLSQWQDYLVGPSIPQPVRESVRIYQRYIPVDY